MSLGPGGGGAGADTQPLRAPERPRPAGRALEVAVLGISVRQACGVRDHAALLGAALAADGAVCTTRWLSLATGSLQAERQAVRGWCSELETELLLSRPDAVLLHYSVFSYSHRGVPVFLHPVLAAVRACGIPIVGLLHEFAYPWHMGGARGKVWSLAQRALMIELVRASAVLVVTTEQRVAWLRSRPWLPRRDTQLAPVFSTLPAPSAAAMPAQPRGRPVVGLFGYSYEGAAVGLILEAMRELRAAGQEAELRLLGAPGRDSAAGSSWLAGARSHGLGEALTFSGSLPAQELSDELAACEVLLFADAAGPSSRKTTFAGSLASGRPVIAFDGPASWRAVTEQGAARVVAPSPQALARELASLLGDHEAASALGSAGRGFYEREMRVERSADVVAAALARAARAA